MPPIKGPSLVVPSARGGTVRTRYFNGMFITKEDLWTDQNNNRIKHALMNRAMGQGVVWGLDVGLDGDAVCVLPGYGVDCCGNDIVISSAYRVDSHALLRDPAAAATLSKGRANRMNLLLEYFECPEEPRPVHGDPCAPDQVSCEMSRIRETARLRLVPPCDVDDSGPIKDFLEEIRKLKGHPMTGPAFIPGTPPPPPPVVPAPAPAPAPGPTTTTIPADASTVPFQVVVESLHAGLCQKCPDRPEDRDAKLQPDSDLNEKVRVTVATIGGAKFTSGAVHQTQPVPRMIASPSLPPGGVEHSRAPRDCRRGPDRHLAARTGQHGVRRSDVNPVHEDPRTGDPERGSDQRAARGARQTTVVVQPAAAASACGAAAGTAAAALPVFGGKPATPKGVRVSRCHSRGCMPIRRSLTRPATRR